MRFNWTEKSLTGVITTLVFMTIISGCGTRSAYEDSVIFTQLPVNLADDGQILKGDYRYAPNMKIVIAGMNKTLENIEVLTSDFYSARSPEVSYDGTQLVFSGQKNEGDIWQIWIMHLSKKSFVQVTQETTNCTDPTWLPDGRIAYSKATSDHGVQYHALFSIESDGCCEHRITFHPHDDLNSSVMHDGRILIASRQVYPDAGTLTYLALRPDGTKAELFYMPEGSKEISRAYENGKGKVLFAESGTLSAVNFSRPLHSHHHLYNTQAGLIQSVFPIENELALVSIKNKTERSFGLSIIQTDATDKSTFFYNNSEYHLIEPVVVRLRTIPRKLPTLVNLDHDSGYFICMNADQSDIQVEAGKTSKIQVLGFNAVLGETEVDEDGSFYLELKADEPVRFQTLNSTGEVLRGPSSWMWVRPNERRGCVGCHENREIAPENIVPKAIERSPFAMIK
jgi:hypothetical protein